MLGYDHRPIYAALLVSATTLQLLTMRLLLKFHPPFSVVADVAVGSSACGSACRQPTRLPAHRHFRHLAQLNCHRRSFRASRLQFLAPRSYTVNSEALGHLSTQQLECGGVLRLKWQYFYLPTKYY